MKNAMLSLLVAGLWLVMAGNSIAQQICYDHPDGTDKILLPGWSYKDYVIPEGYRLDSVHADFRRNGYPEKFHDFILSYCSNTTVYDGSVASSLLNYDNIDASLYHVWIDLTEYRCISPGVLRVYLPTNAGASWNSLCLSTSKEIIPTEDFDQFRIQFLSDKDFAYSRISFPIGFYETEAGTGIRYEYKKLDLIFSEVMDTSNCYISIEKTFGGMVETKTWDGENSMIIYTLTYMLNPDGKYYLTHIMKEID